MTVRLILRFLMTLLLGIVLTGMVMAAKPLELKFIKKNSKPVVLLNKVEQVTEHPGNWQGPADLSAVIYCWLDGSTLWMSVKVTDDRPLWNPRGFELQAGWWKTTFDGDGLRIYLSNESTRSQVFILPGMYGVEPKLYVLLPGYRKWQEIKPEVIRVVYTEPANGYIIETGISLDELGLSPDNLFAQFELYDSDGPPSTCKTMKSEIIPIKK